MKEIKKSINSVEDSFILLLHEKCTFSIPKLNQIYSEIEELLESHTMFTNKEIEACFFIYSKMNHYLIYHFDPQDLYTISNLPENYNEYLARFTELIRRLITMYPFYLNKEF